MTITIKDLTGEYAMTMNDGQALYKAIQEKLDERPVIDLDFTGVNLVMPHFVNTFVGNLILNHGHDVIDRLRFQKMTNEVESSLKRYIECAKEYYLKSPEERERIDKIVMAAIEDDCDFSF